MNTQNGAPILQLGRGQVAVSFAPAVVGSPALLLFSRPAPGVDASPRRIELEHLPDAERRADWRDELSRAVLVLQADATRGFDALLSCVAESALAVHGDKLPRTPEELQALALARPDAILPVSAALVRALVQERDDLVLELRLARGATS
jgi:hypothetical protein